MNNFLHLSLIVSLSVLASSCYSTGKGSSNTTITPPPKTILETDILQTKPGYTGNILGATITEVKIEPETEQQIVDIKIPVDPEQVDQIQVVSDTGETLKQKKTAEILRNYENDNVGVTIYISRQKNLSFKLRLIDKTEDD